MPHTARKRSISGFYHVVSKGIGSQVVFEDATDRTKYIQLLKDAKDETHLLLHAYCLMSNHTHLIVEDPENQLSSAMKYLDERYAMYFAGKTGREGGIFRKPYWSEPIEMDGYLLCAVRYVHANPANAGICQASAYKWSSARDYLGRIGITDTDMVLNMCGGKEGFISFSKPSKTTLLPFPGSKLRNHEPDDEALVIARTILGYDPSDLPGKDRDTQAQAIAKLAHRGFNKARLIRISGLGRYVVNRHFPR